MQVVEITEDIKQDTGATIPAGAICVLSIISCEPINEIKNQIPAAITYRMYLSEKDFLAGAVPVPASTISALSFNLTGLNLEQLDYETIPTETLAIQTLLRYLLTIYENNCQIINV